MMDITTQELSHNETTTALALVWEVFTEFEAPDYSQEGIDEFRSFLSNQGEMNKLQFIGAFIQDKIVGIIAMRQDHISLLFVKKEFHRQGIAKKLFWSVLSQNKGDRITVNSSPYALEIYRKLGFIATNTEQITNGIRYTPMTYARKGHVIEPGTPADMDELEKLYDDLNDYLSATINHPGWIKGIYPTREDAVRGIENNTLYVARYDGKITGSIILDHQPEEAYNNVEWKVDVDYKHVFVIRTFVVHPSFLKRGIGLALMNYSLKLAQNSGIQSIRLDVYEKNLPAISLYEKCGFDYIGTVDLGLSNYGLDWFKLYEKVVN